jgi:hypothetical protein
METKTLQIIKNLLETYLLKRRVARRTYNEFLRSRKKALKSVRLFSTQVYLIQRTSVNFQKLFASGLIGGTNYLLQGKAFSSVSSITMETGYFAK